MEWDYGDYEGLTTAEIRETVPGWTVWTHGAPGGETRRRRRGARWTPWSRSSRPRRPTSRCSPTATSCACWRRAGLDARRLGARLALATGTLSVLGWERETRCVRAWNA